MSCQVCSLVTERMINLVILFCIINTYRMSDTNRDKINRDMRISSRKVKFHESMTMLNWCSKQVQDRRVTLNSISLRGKDKRKK